MEVLEIARTMGRFANQKIHQLLYHVFFLFDIQKLFEHPEIFKKMNRLHSSFYRLYKYPHIKEDIKVEFDIV